MIFKFSKKIKTVRANYTKCGQIYKNTGTAYQYIAHDLYSRRLNLGYIPYC